jgi:hypothetical protein
VTLHKFFMLARPFSCINGQKQEQNKQHKEQEPKIMFRLKNPTSLVVWDAVVVYHHVLYWTMQIFVRLSTLNKSLTVELFLTANPEH